MENNIYILTNFNFNKSYGAAWSRVDNYLQCFKDSNTNVYVSSSKYNYKSGIIINELYQNSYRIFSKKGFHKKYKSYIENFCFLYYYKYYNKIYQFSKDQKSNKKIFFLYSFNFASVTMSLLYFKILKRQKLFCEKNELQFAIALNQQLPFNFLRILPVLFLQFISIILGFLQDILSNYFDGLIVISSRFEKLYKRVKVIKVPILANKQFFRCNPLNLTNDNLKICYSGDVNQNKDGILDLLEALTTIERPILVDLYGIVNKKLERKIKYKIKILKTHQINLYGEIPWIQLPEIFNNYNLLISPRPSNLQTEFGFSTKLAEYLASSIPVLASKVSDNEVYLEDKVNAFLFEAGNISALKMKLEEIQNYDRIELIKIGIKGREIAQNHFIISHYNSLLYNFFFNNIN
ncbi:MAG: glycosyltransferase [Bacteroidota bacterium]